MAEEEVGGILSRKKNLLWAKIDRKVFFFLPVKNEDRSCHEVTHHIEEEAAETVTHFPALQLYYLLREFVWQPIF